MEIQQCYLFLCYEISVCLGLFSGSITEHLMRLTYIGDRFRTHGSEGQIV